MSETILCKTESNLSPASQVPAKRNISDYIKAATSDNTRRAYRADIAHYINWAGPKGLPATTDIICQYLQTYANSLKPDTLKRRVTALRKWHEFQLYPDPCQGPVLAKLLKGIQRVHGQAKQSPRALELIELKQILSYLRNKTDLFSLQAMAWLQLGFFAALRRTELVAIEVKQLTWNTQGLKILIPRSKTDQSAEGHYVYLPYGNAVFCPVEALKNWISQAKIETGPVFRRIWQKKGLAPHGLSASFISIWLKKIAEEAGLKQVEQLSAHSLRSGLATAGNRQGDSLSDLMQQGRWSDPKTVMKYVQASLDPKQTTAGRLIALGDRV